MGFDKTWLQAVRMMFQFFFQFFRSFRTMSLHSGSFRSP